MKLDDLGIIGTNFMLNTNEFYWALENSFYKDYNLV